MGVMDEFLKRLDMGFEPKALSVEEELQRTRSILVKLGEKAADAAEAKYPGIASIISFFVKKEEILAKKAADASFVMPGRPRKPSHDANGCWIENE